MQRNLSRLSFLSRSLAQKNKFKSASVLIETPMIRTFFSRRCFLPDRYLEYRMRDMDRYFDRVERDLVSAFDSSGRFASPLSGNLYSFFNFPVAVESRVSTEPGENGKPGKYTLQLHLGKQFSPEDIKLSLKDRNLTIEAKLQFKSKDGSPKVYQEITRQYTLPEGIKPEEVKSFVSDGVVSIEAPLPEPEVSQPKPTEIPINIKK